MPLLTAPILPSDLHFGFHRGFLRFPCLRPAMAGRHGAPMPGPIGTLQTPPTAFRKLPAGWQMPSGRIDSGQSWTLALWTLLFRLRGKAPWSLCVAWAEGMSWQNSALSSWAKQKDRHLCFQFQCAGSCEFEVQYSAHLCSRPAGSYASSRERLLQSGKPVSRMQFSVQVSNARSEQANPEEGFVVLKQQQHIYSYSYR